MRITKIRQFYRAPLALLILFFVLGAGWANAQDAVQLEGTNESALEQEVPSVDVNETAILDEQTAAEIARQESLFSQAILDIETAWGPYDGRLVEALLSAGRHSLEMGRFDEASGRFERALNVSRVSSGLLNPEQIQILELLVDALSGAGQWEDADNRVHLAFYLQRKLLNRDSEEYAQAVIEYGDWKLASVYNADFRLNDSRELAALEEVYSDLLSGDEESRRNLPTRLALQNIQASQWSSQTKVDLLNQIALTHYSVVIANLSSVPSYLLYPEPPYTYQTVCSTVTNADGSISRVCRQQRVENRAFWDQQNERARFRQDMEQRTREFGATTDAMSAMASSEPNLRLGNGELVSARVEEMKAMNSRLTSSVLSLRGW